MASIATKSQALVSCKYWKKNSDHFLFSKILLRHTFLLFFSTFNTSKTQIECFLEICKGWAYSTISRWYSSHPQWHLKNCFGSTDWCLEEFDSARSLAQHINHNGSLFLVLCWWSYRKTSLGWLQSLSLFERTYYVTNKHP